MDGTPAPDRYTELEDALDFINTLEHSGDGDTDHLPSIQVALDWLQARGALRAPVEMAGSAELSEIRAARAAMREVADAVVYGRPADPAAVARVNRLLEQRDVPVLRTAPAGVAVGARHAADPIAHALAHLVDPLVEEIADGAVERLRVCANDSCRWVFYDTSRTARRRWCSMTTCGNRAKARRHRQRHRLGADDGVEAPAR